MNTRNRQERIYHFLRNILGYSDKEARKQLDKILTLENESAKHFVPVFTRYGSHEGLLAELSLN